MITKSLATFLKLFGELGVQRDRNWLLSFVRLADSEWWENEDQPSKFVTQKLRGESHKARVWSQISAKEIPFRSVINEFFSERESGRQVSVIWDGERLVINNESVQVSVNWASKWAPNDMKNLAWRQCYNKPEKTEKTKKDYTCSDREKLNCNDWNVQSN